MSISLGWGARPRALFSDNKGPWGSSGGGDEPPARGKGPWGDQPRRGGDGGGGNPPTSLDEFLRRSRNRFGGSGGGSGGGLAGRPGGFILWAAIALIALSLLASTMHSIAPAERGVVTRFGRYSHTMGPGFQLTLPAPIDRVAKVDVEENREIYLGSAESEDLMLTGDQNIIDIAYLVRWKRQPQQYLFELAEPEETIKQVAESAMRAVVANVTLQGAIGNQRGDIESRVQEEMQRTLDFYQAGVMIQGVSIKQADPPAAVNDAFKEVTAAQQEAQSSINQANAYSLQLKQIAQGEATAFDKVYEQYKLSPQVTKRRMYYETMERVLQKVDKTIIEAPGVQSYLPLNELKRSAPAREPAQ